MTGASNIGTNLVAEECVVLFDDKKGCVAKNRVLLYKFAKCLAKQRLQPTKVGILVTIV